MLENTDDSYKNITSFFLAYMTDSAYDALEASSCQYKVVYSDDSDDTVQKRHERAVQDKQLSCERQ